MNPKDDNDLSYVLPIGSFLFLSKHNSVIEDLPSMREALNPIVGTGGREGGGGGEWGGTASVGTGCSV